MSTYGLHRDTQRHVFPAVDIVYNYMHVYVHVHKYMHVLTRDEKEGRSKQGQTNKKGKATQHTQGSHFS